MIREPAAGSKPRLLPCGRLPGPVLPRYHAGMETVTSDTLLAGLRDPANQTVWQGYVERYRPVLLGWFRRVGVPEADAEDLCQDTLAAFAQAYRAGSYDRQAGRLRAWLFGFARNHLRGRHRRRQRAGAGQQPATGFLDGVEDEARDLEQAWEQEWRDAVLRRCLELVRAEVTPATFDAFVLFARDGLPAREVARRVGMTENAVFGCKRRVLQRLRELQPEIDAVF